MNADVRIDDKIDTRIDKLIGRVDRLAMVEADLEVAWGGASTPAAISRVEQALGVRLPESFRRFQLKTGGDGLDGLRISTIPANDTLGNAGTVYGDTMHYRDKHWIKPLPIHLVVIQRCADDNEPFCLDTAAMMGDECPVVLYYHQTSGHIERIARNFLDFYEAYLDPYFDENGV